MQSLPLASELCDVTEVSSWTVYAKVHRTDGDFDTMKPR